MKDTFIIQQQLTLTELYKVSLYLGARNKKLKKFYYLVPGIVFLAGLSNIFLDPKRDTDWITLIPEILIPPLFPIAFFFIGTFLICLFLLLMKPDNFRNITYEFTHWGMFKKNKYSEYSCQWSGFIKLKETKHFLLLYITENDAHIIQKRMFADAKELEDFKFFTEKQVGLLSGFL